MGGCMRVFQYRRAVVTYRVPPNNLCRRPASTYKVVKGLRIDFSWFVEKEWVSMCATNIDVPGQCDFNVLPLNIMLYLIYCLATWYGTSNLVWARIFYCYSLSTSQLWRNIYAFRRLRS